MAYLKPEHNYNISMRNELINSEAFRDVRAMLNVLGIHLTEKGPSMDLNGECEMIMTENGPKVRPYNITE